MYPPLISVFIWTLGMVGAFPTRVTDQSELKKLLKRLYPMASNHELIRLGPKGDGGYVIPNDLDGIEACFSPGVSVVSGFEKDCADLGMKVFLADKSVSGPVSEHALFSFTKKFVGATSDQDFMTIDEWVASALPECQSDLLLQIDIEGCEYEVFLSTSDSLLRRFRIIVAEFHYLDHLWSAPFFQLAGRAFDKLLQTHACIHIHPNNVGGVLRKNGLVIPPVMEFTFQRRDRLTNPSYQRMFPSPLDHDNTDNRTVVLPRCWYGRD